MIAKVARSIRKRPGRLLGAPLKPGEFLGRNRLGIVDDGERLSTVSDSSQDFEIANYLLEHCQYPIQALRSMLRVLRAGGILYLAIPDKRYTFDKNRPVTPIEHLMRDFQEGPAWSRRKHYEDWTMLVDRVRGEAEVAGRIRELMDREAPIHYHAWTQVELLELILAVRRMRTFEIELIFKRDHDVIFIARKNGGEPAADVPIDRLATGH